MKRLTTIGSILTLGILLTALNSGGSAGCGSSSGGGGGGGGSGDSQTATEDDAFVAASAAIQVANSGLQTGLTALSLQGGGKASQILDTLRNEVTITPTTSCTDGGVPNATDETVLVSGATLSGSSLGTGGSGSCTLDADGTETDTSASVDIAIDCNALSFSVEDPDGNDVAVGLNGGLGVSADVTLSGGELEQFDLSIGTDNLTMDIGDKTDCSIIIDLDATVTGNESSMTVGIEGCVTVCGEGFSATGTETVSD